MCWSVGSANQIAELLISRVIKCNKHEAQRAPTKNVRPTIDKRLSMVLRCKRVARGSSGGSDEPPHTPEKVRKICVLFF